MFLKDREKNNIKLYQSQTRDTCLKSNNVLICCRWDQNIGVWQMTTLSHGSKISNKSDKDMVTISIYTTIRKKKHFTIPMTYPRASSQVK